MGSITDWFLNLEVHEIVLWVLIIILLVWEFVIQRRIRKPLESDIKQLKSKFRKLDISTELSKKEIYELYKKMKEAEKEIETMKRVEKQDTDKSMKGHGRIRLNKQHAFVLRMLEDAEGNKVEADFGVAFYLNVFKDKDKSQYTNILGDLVDYNLIDLVSDDGKTYVILTHKGHKSAEAINKIKK